MEQVIPVGRSSCLIMASAIASTKNKNMIYHSSIGLLHLVFAVVAMLTGALVLLRTKGDLLHKRVGYVYVFSMLALNVSAFGIYHLFGRLGIFHGLALLSLLTIVGGMYPALTRRKPEWVLQHLETMSWSVVGLYAAFCAEIGVRCFDMRSFWWVVALSSGLVCLVGKILIDRKLAKEQKQLSKG